MADTRQSALMPTVKCSSCGNQVEISFMGDHICTSSAAAPEPTPPMPDLLGGAFSSLKNVFGSRPAPPSVDTSAANQANVKPGSPTPMSASTGSRTISPRTPVARSLTGSSGDDFFAPAIAESPPTSQPRRPGGYGGFNDVDPQEGDSTMSSSPQKQGPSLLTRMNTIAPGPFDMNRRPSATRTPEPVEEQLSSSVTSTGSGSMAPPPRMPRKDGYGGFGPPQREGSSPEPLGYGGLAKRSETFPNPTRQEFDEPARRPSVPATRPERFRSHRFSRKDTSRMVPPPRTSLIRPPTRDGNAPAINLADEFGVGNPYHSHSASQSSSNSGYSQTSGSQPSHSSSSTSPARSTGSKMGSQRKASDPSEMEALMNDLESSMESLKPVTSAPPAMKRQAPPENLRLGSSLPSGPAIAKPMPSPMLPPPTSDPAVQHPRSGTPNTHQRMRSRAGTTSRGNCRACLEPITGKSVSSADGRLTGRYHKACFVCTTCKEPFTSTTFYVLGDRPYCEHHYHKLNGSLCGACNKGIEGQFLEDENARKHHVGCFRCGDCGMVLRDGYFDVNGKAYCERDANRRIQQPMINGPSPLGGPVEKSMPGIPEISVAAPQRMPSRAGPGLPSGPNQKLNRPFGLPSGTRLMPGQALGRGALGNPMPRMEKRMTRLGMM